MPNAFLPRKAAQRSLAESRADVRHTNTDYYGSVLPKPSRDPSERPRVLDIASSWISHLPEDWTPDNSYVVGIGMNQAELSKNRALSKYFVVDLNKDPEGLSGVLGNQKDGQAELYDAAVCSVSIDYLTKPREMLADLSKLLKPGATVHLAYSNRCFPTKVSCSLAAPSNTLGGIAWHLCGGPEI